MAEKNCPVCGGRLRTRTDGGCTKCERLSGRYRRVTLPMLILAVAALALLMSYLLWPHSAMVGDLGDLRARVARLEERTVFFEQQIVELEARTKIFERRSSHQERQIAELGIEVQILTERLRCSERRILVLETEIRSLKQSVAQLERTVAENAAAIEELRQRETQPQPSTVAVQSGDTVWELLTVLMGHYPCAEQIQRVVDANGLESFHDSQGRWIVLIYPGQVLDLSPALGG